MSKPEVAVSTYKVVCCVEPHVCSQAIPSIGKLIRCSNCEMIPCHPSINFKLSNVHSKCWHRTGMIPFCGIKGTCEIFEELTSCNSIALGCGILIPIIHENRHRLIQILSNIYPKYRIIRTDHGFNPVIKCCLFIRSCESDITEILTAVFSTVYIHTQISAS